MLDLEKAIAGDKEAFSRVIIQNKLAMYKTAMTILKNEDDVYDALQEALIRMYNNITKLENIEAFKVWSRRIVVNCCYDLINKNKKVVDITSKLTENYEETIEDVYNCEDDLVKILDKIETELHTVITLYYYNDLSVKEIAEVLQIPVGTVKSRLSRAREKLYEILKEERREN